MILHLALFTWRDDVTADDVAELTAQLRGDGRRHPGTAQLSLRREPAAAAERRRLRAWRPIVDDEAGLAAYLDSAAHKTVYDQLLGRMIERAAGCAAAISATPG